MKLRVQAARCDFDVEGSLVSDSMIIDQIAEKCLSSALRKKVLEKDRPLEEVVAIGKTMEDVEQQCKEMSQQEKATFGAVNKGGATTRAYGSVTWIEASIVNGSIVQHLKSSVRYNLAQPKRIRMSGSEMYRMPLGAFDDKVDSQDLRREWEEWQLCLQVRNIDSQHEKFVTMLSVGGRGLQRIFFNLRPVPEEVTPELVRIPLMPLEIPEYDNAVRRLEKFFVGKRNERVELEVFRSIKQTTEEPFNNFILRLRSQAARCEFADREETEILQQITMGAKDEKVRDKGLENSMNLDEVINYAINREILVKQREKLKPFRNEPDLNSVHPRQLRNNNRSPKRNSKVYPRFVKRRDVRRAESEGSYPRMQCERCGSFRHNKDSRECYARGATCNRCGQRGHYARKCTGNSAEQRAGRFPRRVVERHTEEANSLEPSEVTWKEELPHRPTSDDVAKVE
ncbi:uncharacterized protein LOC134213420 [Armigeres subalbatus]|uniref:uncharacterized protein LOC134213420 n=1 Tax=Armigeres subalbatus TaxID=124917 RepID=UPI002ED16A42